MIQVDLSEQVALVTGASRGIGAAIAKRLAAAGARVIVNHKGEEEGAREVVAAIEATGGTASYFEADVSDEAAVVAMFKHVVHEHGRLDVLVNNAGIVKDGLLATMRVRDWKSVLDVNLGGAWLCSRQALRSMMPARRGRIINIASVQGLRGGRGQANYAASKAGVLALTRATALEVADRGIRANAILPGFIDTDMTARVKRHAGEQVAEQIPVKRLGQPQDLTGILLFLCSEDADYITGQSFVVDGGWTVL